MKEDRYDSVDEWKLDLDRIKSNPDNTNLIIIIAQKLKNSSKDTQDEVNEHLENYILGEPNPSYALVKVADRFPNKQLVIWSHKDPFFKC